MRLTQWTDYTLRVLMYCAASKDRSEPVTITEIAESHGISRSHLTKVVQQLAARGWLETTRGRGGGLRLAQRAKDLCLGTIVRATETDFAVVECFEPSLNQCRMDQNCRLKGVLNQATQSFLAVLDGTTLADLVAPVVNVVDLPKSRRLQGVPGLPGASV
ncbi:RrF2 family transcriptional regulator [Rhodoferax sp.]|jgi:Rrf2 family nitric oxide-sensitive transcriptional repressor|uniref:RrF2 family transcriptional regulator n=1 Tax=Rhodoferax sp. TaxID=50421 RepID=UPI0027229D1C|nr:Rrf2 family transcriptional regulator [Rhodoferax sp.]MDO9143391.1 Rrf2 family transcriptional regulator [Rhodoferax sp.]MDP1529180.1 Rrf2 family transcriptional regulator [Rhodoferax sp.]MDP1943993.1 Rrf2 family transcriptional regulator [Rhodoferax sp.]MDP2441648.1 Rrf2 family transcriptional regulator [Rhodoferax sp.]MDP3190556.1 Rrf2 family transcriptional regulator [Rhodoferax sp.]